MLSKVGMPSALVQYEQKSSRKVWYSYGVSEEQALLFQTAERLGSMVTAALSSLIGQIKQHEPLHCLSCTCQNGCTCTNWPTDQNLLNSHCELSSSLKDE